MSIRKAAQFLTKKQLTRMLRKACNKQTNNQVKLSRTKYQDVGNFLEEIILPINSRIQFLRDVIELKHKVRERKF